MKDGRLTVGLFVADMADDFSRGICKGAIDAAYDADANLIVIPGNYFDRDLSIYDSLIIRITFFSHMCLRRKWIC